MSELLPPVLDDRDAERVTAEVIARTSGGLTLAHIDYGIEVWRRLRGIVASGGEIPACPELTNANPSSPHTVLLEAMGYLASVQSYKINQLPVRDQIEFARLFVSELRAAVPATTTLRFTVNSPAGVAVTIPAGTAVANSDNSIVFETDSDLTIPYNVAVRTGDVAARRTLDGATMLAPETLTRLLDALPWVASVTNVDAVDSGSSGESVAQALERARSMQRRARRLVTVQDFEEAIRDEAFEGNEVVRVFPRVRDGQWAGEIAGHTTIVLMTRNGFPVSAEIKARVRLLTEQAIGNQFIYLKDPTFVDFTVQARFQTASIATQDAARAAVERNLRDFYAVEKAQFGKAIYRSEIIAVIEGTAGVDSIIPQPGNRILAQPIADMRPAPFQLPRLVGVTINV